MLMCSSQVLSMAVFTKQFAQHSLTVYVTAFLLLAVEIFFVIIPTVIKVRSHSEVPIMVPIATS